MVLLKSDTCDLAMTTTEHTKRTFVEWNARVFRRCRAARRDVLTPQERRTLRLGFLRFHPRLRGVPPAAVGSVGFSVKGRAKSAFFCDVRGQEGQGRRVYLPRKCKVLSPQQRLNNLLRGSVRSQTDKVRRPGFEVDHHGEHTRFEQLAADWMRAHGLRTDQLVCSQRCVHGIHMLGEPYHRSWYEYHARHADLRRIRPKAHAEKTRAQHKRQAAWGPVPKGAWGC